MKTKMIFAVMALGIFSSLPVFADQISTRNNHGDSRPCAKQGETLQEKIRRLQEEISEGEKVLSKDELGKLNDELNEAKRSLRLLNRR